MGSMRLARRAGNTETIAAKVNGSVGRVPATRRSKRRPEGVAVGFGLAHAGADVGGYALVVVETEFGVQMGFDALGVSEALKPSHKEPPSALSRMSPIAFVSRAQLSVSSLSCFRPLAVNR
jgi:hypothetical protein